MPFSDKYPEQIEFEIDRRRLKRYLRLRGFGGCLGGTTVVSLFVSFAAFTGTFQHQPIFQFDEVLQRLVAYLAGGLAVGCVIGLLLYFVTTHFVADWAAQNLRLIVEGPYLRLVSGGVFVSDRRMHFRTINDYSTHSDPLLRRLGIKSLSFRVEGNSRLLTTVAGLVDPDDVRDALCEIDAAREN